MPDRGRLFYDSNGKLRQVDPDANITGEPDAADLEPVEFVSVITEEADVTRFIQTFDPTQVQSEYRRPGLESLDVSAGFTAGSGASGTSNSGVFVQTGTTQNSNGRRRREWNSGRTTLDFDKQIKARFQVEVNTLTEELRALHGNNVNSNKAAIGFQFANGDVEGFYRDSGGTRRTETLVSGASTGVFDCHVNFVPSEKVEWWVNANPSFDSPDKSVTSNLPSGSGGDHLWLIEASNPNSATNARIDLYDVEVFKEA